MKKNIARLLLTACCFFAGLSVRAGTNAVSGDPMPPPGRHPRVLITKADIPGIRTRAGTPLGQSFLRTLHWPVDGGCRLLLEAHKKDATTTFNPYKFNEYVFNAALIYIIEQKPAYLETVKELLAWWKTAGCPAESRSDYKLALVYDLLYDELPETARNALRGFLIKTLLFDPAVVKDFYSNSSQLGPCFMGRGCDWGAISSGGMILRYLAVEGEDATLDRKIFDLALRLLQFNADYTLTPEGAMPNGNQYISDDFEVFFVAVQALKRHGHPIIENPNIREVATWLAYETIPGYYRLDNSGQSGGVLPFTATLVTLAANYDGAAQWVQQEALGPLNEVASQNNGAGTALLYGRFPDAPVPAPDLPPTRYSSSMGTVYSRTGWAKDADIFTIYSQAPGHSHAHPDKGSFTFYSRGIALATDSGVHHFEAIDHNTVLVNGGGQPAGQNQTETIVRSQLASDLADLTHMDLKPAYEQVLDHSARTVTNEPFDHWYPKYGNGLPLEWRKVDSYDHVDRYAIFVRGYPRAYAVIIDDVQKNNKPQRYDWVLHSSLPARVAGLTAVYQGLYEGAYVQAATNFSDASYSGQAPAEGRYTLWALTRPWPDLHRWWWCGARVNGVQCSPFYLSHYSYGWGWCQLVAANSSNLFWNLRAGPNEIHLDMAAGSQVAQVIATTNSIIAPYTPASSISNAIVFAINEKQVRNGTWIRPLPDPATRMNVHFLYPSDTNAASLAWFPKPGLLATQTNVVRAGYAAVLLPYDNSNRVELVRDIACPNSARIEHGGAVDYIVAQPVPGPASEHSALVTTDAKFALVRTDGDVVKGYVISAGTRLNFKGRDLFVASTGPVYAVNDGRTCRIDAPQGTSMKADLLAAKTAICNREPALISAGKSVVSFTAPVLPKKWEISFADDGRTVIVAGDGPRPLRIHAPKAIECLLNGVSVYFSRAQKGDIYPKLDITIPTHGDDPGWGFTE